MRQIIGLLNSTEIKTNKKIISTKVLQYIDERRDIDERRAFRKLRIITQNKLFDAPESSFLDGVRQSGN